MENLHTVVQRCKKQRSCRILETTPASNFLCLLPVPPSSRRLKSNLLSSTIEIFSFLFKDLFKAKG